MSGTLKPDDFAAAGLTAEQLGEWVEVDPTSGFAWPDPAPIPSPLFPVPAFDAERLLPDPLRTWVVDIAQRTQCPIDFVGTSAMVAAGALVGRQVVIRPKVHDDWTVVPNLWGMSVGPPGIMKTPGQQAALRPLHRLVHEARQEHQQALGEHAALAVEQEMRRDILKKELHTAINQGTPTEALRQALAAAGETPPPTERRYVVNDATVEKLGELLNKNPNGVLLYRDELAGFLRSMERDGHENDRAFYCEAWAGHGSYVYDRIGRGTLFIEAACVSVLGAIQPGPLRSYLREALKGGADDDGLIQRLQLAVYPDVARVWKNIDRWPDDEAKNGVFQVFRALTALEAEDLAARRHTPEDLPCLHFTPEAQVVFDQWRATLEHRLRAGEEHDALIAHLSKYRSLMPSLALILHLIDCVSRGTGGRVTLEAAERAVCWSSYLEAHARRIYQAVTDRAGVAAVALGKKIRTSKLPSPFTVRHVSRAQWAGLTEREDVLPALAVLETLFWVREEPSPRSRDGGRPTTQYRINPKLIGWNP